MDNDCPITIAETRLAMTHSAGRSRNKHLDLKLVSVKLEGFALAFPTLYFGF